MNDNSELMMKFVRFIKGTGHDLSDVGSYEKGCASTDVPESSDGDGWTALFDFPDDDPDKRLSAVFRDGSCVSWESGADFDNWEYVCPRKPSTEPSGSAEPTPTMSRFDILRRTDGWFTKAMGCMMDDFEAYARDLRESRGREMDDICERTACEYFKLLTEHVHKTRTEVEKLAADGTTMSTTSRSLEVRNGGRSVEVVLSGDGDGTVPLLHVYKTNI